MVLGPLRWRGSGCVRWSRRALGHVGLHAGEPRLRQSVAKGIFTWGLPLMRQQTDQEPQQQQDEVLNRKAP